MLGRAVVEDRARRRARPTSQSRSASTRDGVDDEQQVVVVEPVGDQVVDRAAVLVEKQRVLRLAHADPAQVVREHRLEELERGGAAHLELAHVAHVEDARRARAPPDARG